jgi:energy-coupling factor transporter ATP-binding protein EcfA2
MLLSDARHDPTQPVFRARGLTKVYRMGEVEVHALRGVDLDLFAGEFVVLLGASGSGTSTLLNILGGLDAPTAGVVECRGHPLTGAGHTELTRFRREGHGRDGFDGTRAGLVHLANTRCFDELGHARSFGDPAVRLTTWDWCCGDARPAYDDAGVRRYSRSFRCIRDEA